MRFSLFSIYSFFIVELIFHSVHSETLTEDKVIQMLRKINHESEAVKILNECAYNNLTFNTDRPLQLMFSKQWMKAVNMIVDFLTDYTKTETQNEIKRLTNDTMTYLQNVKGLLTEKKKNIVRISPIFEWSQDNDIIKIRLKFAKNLESPGEKDIQNFRVNLNRTHLEVQGYKLHEDYVAWYYRNVHLYEFAVAYSVQAYKETEGTYIIKFLKGTQTMYWNFLDQITGDHSNMFTWIDVFTSFENKAKYTEFRDWTQDNLLLSDYEDHIKGKFEEKQNRLKKIQNIATYLKTKDYENKNFCNSPPNEKFCLLTNIYEWNYWLS